LSKSYYELLDLPRTASPEDIKRAFRREIAKYHPDKVQHLGQEFQDIAVTKAAELTQAYKILSDPAARGDYDVQLEEDAPSGRPAPGQTATYQRRTAPPEPAASRPPHDAPAPPSGTSGSSSVFAQERAGATDLIRRATLARFRQALEGEFGRYEESPLPGFEITCIPKPAFFSLRLPPRVLVRMVPEVDAAVIAETWALASRMKKDSQRDLCVFVLGPRLRSPSELAGAISEQRKKPMPAGGKLVMVPTSTLNWNAHVPTDAPPAVKSLLSRLKSS
jgi:curved DNA-binding protein CbpA